MDAGPVVASAKPAGYSDATRAVTMVVSHPG
jgi:hypothetical protein